MNNEPNTEPITEITEAPMETKEALIDTNETDIEPISFSIEDAPEHLEKETPKKNLGVKSRLSLSERLKTHSRPRDFSKNRKRRLSLNLNEVDPKNKPLPPSKSQSQSPKKSVRKRYLSRRPERIRRRRRRRSKNKRRRRKLHAELCMSRRVKAARNPNQKPNQITNPSLRMAEHTPNRNRNPSTA